MPTSAQIIHSDPETLGGMPVFVGTRVPVQMLLDYFTEGASLDEFLDHMETEETPPQFAICIQNAGYPVSLELRKIYQVLPDEKAAKHDLIRVIDESGEDYLYPQRFFVPIELPQTAEEAFLHGALV